MRIGRIFGLAFFTGFTGAMMPGPLLALTIGQVAVTGLMAVVWLILGHALLEIVTLGLLLGGLRRVMARPRVRGGISLVGGVALLYMGVDMVRSAPHLRLSLEAGAGVSPLSLMLGGMAVCLANPYFLGWWVTIGTGQLAHTAPRTVAEYLAFYVGHELSDLTWYMFVGVLVVAARHLLQGPWYNWLVGACGVLIVALAVAFLVTGVKLLRGRAEAPSPAVVTAKE
jgi:threonine/homoserine/homoserine lactone efflux protein